MSRVVPVRITDDVLAAIDACVELTKGNRSSFVRDACLHYLKDKVEKDVSFVKLKTTNSEKLKWFASQLNMDHDVLLNNILETTFENMGDDPWGKMAAEEQME